MLMKHSFSFRMQKIFAKNSVARIHTCTYTHNKGRLFDESHSDEFTLHFWWEQKVIARERGSLKINTAARAHTQRSLSAHTLHVQRWCIQPSLRPKTKETHKNTYYRCTRWPCKWEIPFEQRKRLRGMEISALEQFSQFKVCTYLIILCGFFFIIKSKSHWPKNHKTCIVVICGIICQKIFVGIRIWIHSRAN
jgi:hypothetical protein